MRASRCTHEGQKGLLGAHAQRVRRVKVLTDAEEGSFCSDGALSGALMYDDFKRSVHPEGDECRQTAATAVLSAFVGHAPVNLGMQARGFPAG